MYLEDKSSLAESTKDYCKLLTPFTERRKHISSTSWTKYQESQLITEHSTVVISLYKALSMETLKLLSNEYHKDSGTKYDRSISNQEDLIASFLKKLEKPFMRQLLIGAKHCDFYLPEVHLCLEPSSERYSSSPRRANLELHTLNERYLMNGLHTFYFNRFIPEELIRTLTIPTIEPEGVNRNLLIMARKTLPFYISYEELKSIVRSSL